jgi:hypothetical protein
VFEDRGVLKRRVHRSYEPHYRALMDSGLYRDLVEQGALVPHGESAPPPDAGPEVYLDLRPERIRFISYPYEWCFSQLRDAALLTLDVQSAALGRGMVLKDASAYNVQFRQGRPVLIDTLSFERRVDDGPWPAYGQFCRHFLAPLALMSGCDVRLGQLSRVHLDGVPLDLASRLLPRRSWLRPGLLLHLLLHARAEARYATRRAPARKPRLSPRSLLAIVESLRGTVRRLRWDPPQSEWSGYYAAEHNYSSAALEDKAHRLACYLDEVRPAVVWDLGANVGMFSRIAAEHGADTLSLDSDHACVDVLYRELRERRETRILPLVLDLTNPSPAIGWENRERSSLLERGRPDLLLALALVHHLAIANNVPLDRIASHFAAIAPQLVVEFVPKSDSQVQRMLASREDVFQDYHVQGFESAFGRAFEIRERHPVAGSERTLYLMRRRDG